ncbi:MAG: VOC family protein [bacterium]|nr:VOC family protein [bacterium]
MTDRQARNLESSVGGTGRAALHGGSEAHPNSVRLLIASAHMTLMTPPHPPGITAVVVDVTDPNIMAEFWTFALGYVLQPPPQGFETWKAFADALDMSAEDRERYTAIMDPKGVGPRIVFQKVPEGKTAKNRWHIDIDIIDQSLPEDQHDQIRKAGVAAMIERGASEVERFDEVVGRWVLMTDPEGNEFCVL